MAQKQATTALSYEAAADLSGSQFLAVTCTAARKVSVVSGVNDAIVGILQNNPTAGKAAEIDFEGVTKWMAGAAITAGNRVKVTAAGKCIPTAGVGRADGIAMSSAANGEYCEVLLTPAGYTPA